MEGFKRRRFTVAEYYRMGSAGILAADDRVELIEGEIFEMSPIGGRHASCVGRMNRLLTRRVGNRAVVRIQDPVRIGPRTEPQPDVVLARPRADFYAKLHPGAKDILLLVEVSDQTIDRDRRVKVPLYARAGISEVWVVDLETERVESYRAPSAGRYREQRAYGRGERIPLPGLVRVTVSVNDLFGAR